MCRLLIQIRDEIVKGKRFWQHRRELLDYKIEQTLLELYPLLIFIYLFIQWPLLAVWPFGVKSVSTRSRQLVVQLGAGGYVVPVIVPLWQIGHMSSSARAKRCRCA